MSEVTGEAADPIKVEAERVKAIKAVARQLGTPADLLAMVVVHGIDAAAAIAKFQEFKTTGHCRIKSSEWGDRPPVPEPVETDELDE